MDFIILKVNGQDLSNSSHEDAVRCFQLAKEPIIVEVLRRHPSQSSSSKNQYEHNQSKQNITTTMPDAANSNYTVSDRLIYDIHSDHMSSLVSTAVQTDWAGLIEDEDLFSDSIHTEEQINDSLEEFLAHDINFEEVTLQKNGTAEKLGLTVFYSSASGSEDADTEVYISEIVPESLAARDGRLKEGDQILQVNGKYVANKEQTENLFAETNNTVTILVSRCLYQDGDFGDGQTHYQASVPVTSEDSPDYQNSMIEQLMRHQQQLQGQEGGHQEQRCDENTTIKIEKKASTLKFPPPVPLHTDHMNSVISTCSSKISQIPNKNIFAFHSSDERNQKLQDSLIDCTKKVESLNIRRQQPGPREVKLMEAYSSHAWSDTEHIYETIPESDTEPIYSFPYEYHHLTLQNNQVQNQCRSSQMVPGHSSSKSNSSGEEKDSSSAYNTGESCHSNTLTLELHHKGEKDNHKSTLVLCASKNSHQRRIDCNCPMPIGLLATKSNNQMTRKSLTLHRHKYQRERHNSSTSTSLGDTMYTNVENLQQTMILQQHLFMQALNRRNITTKETSARKSKSHGNFQAPNLTQYQFVGSQQVCTTNAWIPPEDKCDITMEWKVKRRSDGTRYIARRPIRNRILKNRAIKISEERAGHTTEDDTRSEMKVGRYWTKEERKRQLERARERKQRQQEIILKQHPEDNSDLLICDCTEAKTLKKPINIVELSHKKMARKKVILDDFTTVQEMLVHGNRVGTGVSSDGNKLMGLLSVTTV